MMGFHVRRNHVTCCVIASYDHDDFAVAVAVVVAL